MKNHKDGGNLSLLQMHMNQYVFLILNWVEIVFLYKTYRRLKKQFYQVDIRLEMLCAVISWVVFSLFYLTSTLFKYQLKEGD